MSEQEINDVDIDEKSLDELAQDLSSSSRRDRQHAAAAIARISKTDPESLVPYGKDILDALNRKEARTRWECLDALTNLVDVDSKLCDKAINDAEPSLFDESNGPARLAAMRFFCRLGATTEKRSAKVWPLINEAIQCYHGDVEFQDMLVAVIDFSAGTLDAEVKAGLAERMSFDAVNGKGLLQKRAVQIVENVSA
ncbi:MAG: hypothetical protein Q4E12_01840 [Coriobacteriia bacterium]|nr:hypothetical protein [Coriobacteriia bacterium]